MGVSASDCGRVGSVLGQRFLTSTGASYVYFSKYLRNKERLASYEMLFNDTKQMGDDILLPQWNVTLDGGILQVRNYRKKTSKLFGIFSFHFFEFLIQVLNTDQI